MLLANQRLASFRCDERITCTAEAEAAGEAALFDAVNKNGDDIICFKPYPKKTGGNVIDNTAGPHS
jgi:hypothetical protein